MEMTKLAPWNWFKSEQEGSFPRTSAFSSRDPFDSMRMELRRFADSLERDMGISTTARTSSFYPAIDVKDQGSEYVVSVEIPGVDRHDVKLEINNGLLMVQGQKQEEKKEERKNYYRMESAFGFFQRTLNLPLDADEEKVSAKFKNGILDIHIAKQEGASRTKSREISIQ